MQRDNDGATVHWPWADRSRRRNQWNHWNRPGSCLLYWPINRPRRWEERPLRGREKFSIYVLKNEKVNILKSHRTNVTLNKIPKISTQVFNVSYKDWVNSRCVDQSAVYLYFWKKKKNPKHSFLPSPAARAFLCLGVQWAIERCRWFIFSSPRSRRRQPHYVTSQHCPSIGQGGREVTVGWPISSNCRTFDCRDHMVMIGVDWTQFVHWIF